MAAAAFPRATTLTRSADALIWAAMAGILAAAAFEHLMWPLGRALSGADPWGGARLMLAEAALAAPALLLVCALWDLRGALAEFAQGRLFSIRAGAALCNAGEWMLWALLARIVISPTMHAAFAPAPGGAEIALGSLELAMLGLAACVMLTGRILESGAIAHPEQDRIV